MSEYKIEYDGLHNMMITYKLCGILPSKIMINPSDGSGFAEYIIKRKCKPVAEPNDWGFVNYYCTCGHKLLEIANGLNEYMHRYCEECGAEIIYE